MSKVILACFRCAKQRDKLPQISAMRLACSQFWHHSGEMYISEVVLFWVQSWGIRQVPRRRKEAEERGKTRTSLRKIQRTLNLTCGEKKSGECSKISFQEHP